MIVVWLRIVHLLVSRRSRRKIKFIQKIQEYCVHGNSGPVGNKSNVSKRVQEVVPLRVVMVVLFVQESKANGREQLYHKIPVLHCRQGLTQQRTATRMVSTNSSDSIVQLQGLQNKRGRNDTGQLPEAPEIAAHRAAENDAENREKRCCVEWTHQIGARTSTGKIDAARQKRLQDVGRQETTKHETNLLDYAERVGDELDLGTERRGLVAKVAIFQEEAKEVDNPVRQQKPLEGPREIPSDGEVVLVDVLTRNQSQGENASDEEAFGDFGFDNHTFVLVLFRFSGWCFRCPFFSAYRRLSLGCQWFDHGHLVKNKAQINGIGHVSRVGFNVSMRIDCATPRLKSDLVGPADMYHVSKKFGFACWRARERSSTTTELSFEVHTGRLARQRIHQRLGPVPDALKFLKKLANLYNANNESCANL